MSDEPEKVTEVDFETIKALDDAEIRMNCFHHVAIVCGEGEFKVQLECAKRLYEWIMGNKENEEQAIAASEDAECSPKRH